MSFPLPHQDIGTRNIRGRNNEVNPELLEQELAKIQRNFDQLRTGLPSEPRILEIWKSVTSQTSNVTFPGAEIDRDLTSGTDWRQTITPPVDAWLDIGFCIPQVQNIGGAWNYAQVFVLLVAGDNISSTTENEAVTAGANGYIAQAIGESYGPAGVQYISLHAQARVPLVAGGTYTFAPYLNQEGAGPVITCATGAGHRPFFHYTLYTRDS